MPVISILQYGAVGNGTTDNTAAIQDALNYAAANGDAVYIPAGTYDYSGTIADNGVTIYGAGASSVLQATNGANEALILTGSGASVSNLEMLGTGSSRLSTWQSGMIWANGASNYTIDNVLINGSSSVGIASVDSTGGDIYSNTVENTLADSITTVDGSTNIIISHNEVLNSGDDGISIVSYGNQPIVNGVIETDNVVEGNNGGRGMSVVGGENVTITGNYIKGGSSPYAGLYLAVESSYSTLSVSNVTATGNTLVDCGGSGCQGAVTIYSSMAGESLSGLVVNGNTIATPGMCPVQITGSDPVQLELENNTTYSSSSSFLDNANGSASVTQSGNQALAASGYVAGALPSAGVGSVGSTGSTDPTSSTGSTGGTGAAGSTDSSGSAGSAGSTGTVILDAASSQYEIANASGTLDVADVGSGGDGTQMPGVTVMQFTDGTGVFDPTGTAEQVARLYGAAFHRAPDLAGLQNWTSAIDGGSMSLLDVANSFATAPEFASDYGSLSNADFVNQLYQNVLDRAGDPAGVQTWNGVLAAGASRGAVLLGFAESQEYEGDTISITSDNTLFAAGDNDNGEIYRLYEAALGRAPDPTGQAYWASELASGVSETQVAQGFVGSAEFQSDYGANLSPTAFVTLLYQNVLDRAPDQAGLNAWVGQMQQGMSEASVVLGFSDSTEFRADSAAATHANWVFIPS